MFKEFNGFLYKKNKISAGTFFRAISAGPICINMLSYHYLTLFCFCFCLVTTDTSLAE